jgi:hypothetical protein
VVGGLVTATGLTLVWLPALYYLVASRLEAMNARHAQAHADLTDPAGAAT